ncbi:hypothetical protein G7Y89_g7430 [Cudoniella acicularis]|uniref:Uncharacterized protein n=1 Tax=Cudoniella acicularis TaxID=354080 RepID=A0A8H4RKH2_9HELO|nr:hypothetical protein G7Y89_g7430 [Cudoniella acicularis]
MKDVSELDASEGSQNLDSRISREASPLLKVPGDFVGNEGGSHSEPDLVDIGREGSESHSKAEIEKRGKAKSYEKCHLLESTDDTPDPTELPLARLCIKCQNVFDHWEKIHESERCQFQYW